MRSFATSADAAYRADGGDGDRWRVRGATVAGIRHRIDGRRGDDAFAWAELPGGAGLVVAVADGVSATPEAATAAAVAVSAACSAAAQDAYVEGSGVGDLGAGGAGLAAPEGVGKSGLATRCGDAVSAANAAVVSAVGEVSVGATTLVVAVVGADGQWAASRVGDSDALVLGASGEWSAVFDAPAHTDEETVRSGATDALPGPRAARQDAEGELREGEALVLMTDGVVGPLRDGPATVARGLADGLASPPSPLELALLIDFARQGCHDDRTVLAVWLTAEEPPSLGTAP